MKYTDPSGHISQAVVSAAVSAAVVATKAAAMKWLALDAYYQQNAKPVTTYFPVGDNKAIASFQIQEPEIYFINSRGAMEQYNWRKLGIQYRRPTLVPEFTFSPRGDRYRRGLYGEYHRDLSGSHSLLQFADGSPTEFGAVAGLAGVGAVAAGSIFVNHNPVTGTILDIIDVADTTSTAVGDAYRWSQGQPTRTRGSDVAGLAFDGGGLVWSSAQALDSLSTGGPEFPRIFPAASKAIPAVFDVWDDVQILGAAGRALDSLRYTPLESWTD